VKPWKNCERRVAVLLGGRRVPVSGRGRGDAPDVEHPELAIEVKSRKRLPAWVEDALRQAESAVRDGRTPVAVLHQDGQRYADSVVLVRLGDFARLLGRGTGNGERCARHVDAVGREGVGERPEEGGR
jgi:hypothetical protein